MIEEIRGNDIQAVIFDPLAEFHEAQESDNAQMRRVMGFAREIITTTGCAGYIGAHTRKPDKASSKGFAGDLDAIRGASAQAGVIRIAHTLLPASADDAKYWQMQGSHLNYVRLDMAKTNLGRKWTEPTWFTFDEVPISMEERIGVLRPANLSKKEDKQHRYSISSSAVTRSVWGKVRPSAFVVLRLMTSWNLTGAWTGSSLGFSPFRMRSA